MLLAALLIPQGLLLSAMRSFFLLTMNLALIASPRPQQHVTLSYARSLTHGTVHHSSSDGAISPPCDILPLRLSTLSVTGVQLTGLNTQGCFTLRLLTILSET